MTANTTYNTIQENNASYSNSGFIVGGSSNNLFQQNTAHNNSYYGFRVLSSTRNTFINNTITNNQFGLIFEHSSSNLAVENNAQNNLYGMGIEVNNTNNTLTKNKIRGNEYGVYIYRSSRNLVYDNHLENVLNNAYESEGQDNSWNNPKRPATNILGGPFQGGNFYHDYTAADIDGDGLGDTPYDIEGGQNRDQLPLVPPTSNIVHDIALVSLTADLATVGVGQTVNLTIQIFNQGTEAESPTISIGYNTTTFETRQITSLSAWTNVTITISWNTTSISPGNYTIWAEAAPVPGERDTSDNRVTGKTVTILQPDFNIVAAPTTIFIPAGNSTMSTIGLISQGGFSAIITLAISVSPTTPDGPAAVLSQSSVFLVGETMELSLTITTLRTTLTQQYTLNLTASNGALSHSIIITLTVAPPHNEPPVPDFTITPDIPRAGEPITLDASQSFDPDADPIEYLWDLGDGGTATGVSITHTYTTPGTYNITLTITDHRAEANKTVAIIISPALPGPPGKPQIRATSQEVTLTWTPPKRENTMPVIGYRIYRGITPSSLSHLATIGNETSYVDRAVSARQTYYYQVSPLSEGGEGSHSEQVDVLVPLGTGNLTASPWTPIVWTAIASVIIASTIVATVILATRRRGSSGETSPRPA